MRADRIQQAVAALATGDRSLTRNILRDLILENPRDEQAWMLMAKAVEQREQVIDCLERVLQINPDNQIAKLMLASSRGERIHDGEDSPGNIAPFMADPSLEELLQENADFLPPLETSPSPGKVHMQSVEESPTAVDATPDHEDIKRRSYPTARKYEQHEIDKSLEKVRPPRSRNWSLIIGSLLVLITLILAYFGPSLAPKDPLEMSTILRVGEKYITPSYPPGTPGYPLGSDGNGRDLLSRMLWGLRPTLSMVLVVAAFRLVLGTLIGLAAGWSVGLTRRILDTLIAAALAIPVIIVALGGIAAVGVDLGIWAFIFGLSITGWVETARIVREQTQAVRGQVYIEAARAMGAPNITILVRHVINQILSLLWMLFAFEISATLMLTAALGFLGYYIGGDVWVAVTDSTAAAVSGAPELGQMLARSGVSLTRPWGLMAIGALIFMIVLGFNLLGEGLRKQLSLFGKSGSTRWSRTMATFRFWFDEYITWPLSKLPRSPAFRPALVVMLATIVLASGLLWGYNQFIASSDNPQVNVSLQLEHLWASARRDPFGTRWVQAAGPKSPEVVWTFSDEGGFVGGPAVARDGTVYIASNGATLYALKGDGTSLWQTRLPENPVGSPALAEDGHIYIADENGGLSAFTPDGELQWQYKPEDDRTTSAGPVVAKDGTIYYVLQGAIRALSPNGEEIWETYLGASTNSVFSEMVKVSPNGSKLFWGDVILDAKDGSILPIEELAPADQYFIGADGNIYQVEGHDILRWDGEELDATTGVRLTWDHSKFTLARTPVYAGATPEGVVWLFYTGFARTMGFGEDTRLIWINEGGTTIGNAFHSIRNSQVIGIDEEHIVYVCGNLEQGYGDPQCAALSPESGDALWTVILEGSHEVAGGALIPGRLYIASLEGILYALGLPESPPSMEQKTTQVDAELSPAPQSEPIKPSETEGDIPDRSSQLIGPRDGNNMLIFEDNTGFTGSPAVGDDGTIYLLSNADILYALNPRGEVIWEVNLPANPVGAAVIGLKGQIFLSDKDGALSAYSPAGELIWRFVPGDDYKATSGPIVGPDGTIYYTSLAGAAMVQAVSPDGEGLWQSELNTSQFYNTPQVSTDGNFIFFRNEVFDAATGRSLDFNLDFEADEFFTGEDGGNYLRAGGTVVEWTFNGTGITLAEDRVLSSDEHMGDPNQVFVSSDGVVSLHYNTGILFFTRDGEALGTSFPEDTFLTHSVASDYDASAYICGRRPAHLFGGHNPICFALSADSEQPLWEAKLSDKSEKINGSAFMPGAIYVTTEEGRLYIIGTVKAEPTNTTDGGELLFFEDEGGFIGAPAVADDGTLYLLSNSGLLYSLNSQGQINWQADLPSKPVGSPIIGPQGQVYLADKDGTLYAYNPSGELVWRFTPTGEFKAISGPAIGVEGTLYYTLLDEVGMIQAVSPDGEGQWLSELQTSLFYRTPQVSPDGSLIFFRNEIFDAGTGSPIDLGFDFEVDEFFVGQDSRNYLRTGGTLASWEPSGTGAVLAEERVLSSEGRPDNAGVSREGTVWLRYDNQFLWFTRQGEALGLTATSRRYFNHFIAVDEDGNIYTCGEHAQPTCYALSWNTEGPLWEVNLGTEYEKITGVKYRQENLYIATEEGHLYIIGGVK